VKKNLLAALVLLFMNGCFGSSIIGGVPIPWQPIGEWVRGEVVKLVVTPKTDSLAAEALYHVKYYLEGKLWGVDTDARMAPLDPDDTREVLAGYLTRKDGKGRDFLLYPVGYETAYFELYADSVIEFHELTRADNDENLKAQKRVMQKMEKLGEALKKKKEGPDR
jgi:hypothetical protein